MVCEPHQTGYLYCTDISLFYYPTTARIDLNTKIHRLDNIFSHAQSPPTMGSELAL